MSTFNTSAGMLSGPADLWFFKDLIAFSTLALVGGSQLISSSWLAGGSIGGSIGGGLWGALESAPPTFCVVPLL